MEESTVQKENEEQRNLEKKGGFKTLPYIMAAVVFEKTASIGLMANIIIYITQHYHMTSASGTSALSICSASMNFMPAMGALLSDSYFGRFKVILLGSFANLIGITMLWLSAVLHGARPRPCEEGTNNCKLANSSQLALLFSAFAVMAIGAGGIRPCTVAFGADQLDQRNTLKKERVLQSFFNWYYVLVSFSILAAVTVIVYVQDHFGWKLGLGIPMVLMALSTSMFLYGSSSYIKMKGNSNVLSGFVQVFLVSFKKRHVSLRQTTSNLLYHCKEGSILTAPTDTLRFLNKACIITNPQGDLHPDGTSSNPWNLCTVEQVEDAKSVLRVIPIWSAIIMADLMISQGPIMTLQASTMDRHVGSKFQMPASSYSVFAITTLILWVALYERVIIPPLAKVTRRTKGLKLKQRIGVGLILECFAMAVAANVERIRRKRARHLVQMSAMWLVPQHCMIGLSEAFCIVTQIEFYYSELPKGMASLGMALFEMGMGVENLFGSLMVRLIHKLSRQNGRVSWLSNNLNKGHYDYYYWILTLICSINFLYFLVCCWVYGEEGKNKAYKEEETGVEKEAKM